MNTTRDDVMYGNSMGTPSGSEVESARFHAPVGNSVAVTVKPLGSRSKIDDLKARGMTKMNELKHTLSERTEVMKNSVSRASMSAQSNARHQMMKMQSSMRTSPGKWAGIAAATGFGVGMIGRIAQWRSNKHRTGGHEVVIIEAMC